jgi:hypothetical protein
MFRRRTSGDSKNGHNYELRDVRFEALNNHQLLPIKTSHPVTRTRRTEDIPRILLEIGEMPFPNSTNMTVVRATARLQPSRVMRQQGRRCFVSRLYQTIYGDVQRIEKRASRLRNRSLICQF